MENDMDLHPFTSDVLYFRMCDRSAMTAKIETDMEVRFKVYVDDKGAGAMDVKPARN